MFSRTGSSFTWLTTPAGKHAEIDVAFDHVEHRETGAGVREKYLARVEKLEAITNE